jgi:hemerythrin-like domain-containing protein
LQNAVEFLRLYADRQHHGKEEDLLFPELEKKGMPRNGGPIGMMLMEHTFGRSHIARMAEAASASASGDRAATATWADAALDYVALLREHIAKENQILFVMAERILSADDQARLFVEFAGIDANKMGEGEGARLLQLAERLATEASQVVRS